MLALLGCFVRAGVLSSALVWARSRSAWLAASASINHGFGFLVSGLPLHVKVRRALVRDSSAVGRLALKLAVRRLLGEDLVRFLDLDHRLDGDLRDGHVLAFGLLVHEDVGFGRARGSYDRGGIGSVG
uniref:(northern house mosquito) hypothetical protein n=1 Tax=Culex pipiens TaxID=7175 RepID=A0A8D8C9W4_CULPI